MRTFNITVEGKVYQVSVEETTSGVSAPAPAASYAPAPVSAPVAAPAAKAPVPSGGTQLVSPLPGMVVNLKVSGGAAVKKGQVVVVVEAMKMENDIVATADGVITFAVAQGENVAQGQLLAVIK